MVVTSIEDAQAQLDKRASDIAAYEQQLKQFNPTITRTAQELLTQTPAQLQQLQQLEYQRGLQKQQASQELTLSKQELQQSQQALNEYKSQFEAATKAQLDYRLGYRLGSEGKFAGKLSAAGQEGYKAGASGVSAYEYNKELNSLVNKAIEKVNTGTSMDVAFKDLTSKGFKISDLVKIEGEAVPTQTAVPVPQTTTRNAINLNFFPSKPGEMIISSGLALPAKPLISPALSSFAANVYSGAKEVIVPLYQGAKEVAVPIFLDAKEIIGGGFTPQAKQLADITIIPLAKEIQRETAQRQAILSPKNLGLPETPFMASSGRIKLPGVYAGSSLPKFIDPGFYKYQQSSGDYSYPTLFGLPRYLATKAETAIESTKIGKRILEGGYTGPAQVNFFPSKPGERIVSPTFKNDFALKIIEPVALEAYQFALFSPFFADTRASINLKEPTFRIVKEEPQNVQETLRGKTYRPETFKGEGLAKPQAPYLTRPEITVVNPETGQYAFTRDITVPRRYEYISTPLQTYFGIEPTKVTYQAPVYYRLSGLAAVNPLTGTIKEQPQSEIILSKLTGKSGMPTTSIRGTLRGQSIVFEGLPKPQQGTKEFEAMQKVLKALGQADTKGGALFLKGDQQTFGAGIEYEKLLKVGKFKIIPGESVETNVQLIPPGSRTTRSTIFGVQEPISSGEFGKVYQYKYTGIDVTMPYGKGGRLPTVEGYSFVLNPSETDTTIKSIESSGRKSSAEFIKSLYENVKPVISPGNIPKIPPPLSANTAPVQTILEEARPTIVGGEGVKSAFTGKGLYELTSGPVALPILNPSIARPGAISLTPIVERTGIGLAITLAGGLATIPRVSSALKIIPDQATKQVPDVLSIPKVTPNLSSFISNVPVQTPATIPSTVSITIPTVTPITIPTLSPVITPVIPSTAPTTQPNPYRPNEPIIFPFALIDEDERRRRTKRIMKKVIPLFIPEIRRRRKFISLSGPVTLPEAKMIAKRSALGTLGVTIRVRKQTGGFIPLASDRFFKPSKTPFAIQQRTQKQGLRGGFLSSLGERREIRTARKFKGFFK